MPGMIIPCDSLGSLPDSHSEYDFMQREDN